MTATWFHDQATAAITRAAWAITFFGSVGFLTGSSIAVALFLLWRRCWHWLLASVLAMTGASLLGLLLKHMFQCQRPLLENSLVTLSSYDFPSGHTLGGTLFFGILALFVGSEIVRRWPRRVLCFLSALLLVLLFGLSRIQLGAHYLSDVMGGIAAAIVWLAVCWTAIETLRRRAR